MSDHLEKAMAAADHLEHEALVRPEDIMLFGAMHALIDIAESLRNATIRPAPGQKVNFQGHVL